MNNTHKKKVRRYTGIDRRLVAENGLGTGWQKTPGFIAQNVFPGVSLSLKHQLYVIPIGLLAENINDKPTIKAITLAFAIKALFKSSLITDMTYQKISDMFHIGRERVKTSIGILEKMGLIRREGGNMVFKSFRHAGNYKFFEIQDYRNINLGDLKEVERFLRLQAVYIKQSQIDYAANRLTELSDPKNQRELRRARKSVKKYDWGGKADHGQSIKTVSGVSGLSKATAVALLKWGETKGLMTKEKRIVRVGYHKTPEEVRAHPNGHSEFYCHGIRYLAEPTMLQFVR